MKLVFWHNLAVELSVKYVHKIGIYNKKTSRCKGIFDK